MRFTLWLLLCAGSAIVVSGQRLESLDEHRFVVLPPDQGLIMVVSQPDCPLRFEDVKLFVNMRGAWIKSFKLRNQGTKPIRNYTIAAIGSDEWSSGEITNSANYIMPGQIAPPLAPEDKAEAEIVPLTKALREKLKLQGPMKGIVALIVVRVEYDDGSVFEEKGYESQKEYFDKLYGVMNPSAGKSK
jgi:hypothetical protein